jgi:hypothetical protein
VCVIFWVKLMQKFIVVAAITLIVYFLFFSAGKVEYEAGVLVETMPVQEEYSSASEFELNGYDIEPLKSFQIKARVLGRENYSSGRESDLSPIDLALGWGRMSDESVVSKISISQSGRYYHWHVDEFPIPRREIETHSANMHLIPSNDVILDSIEQIKTGDVVVIDGYLVNVKADDGWRWTSSLTRNDTGGGACELIWVTGFRIVTAGYIHQIKG